MKILSFAATYVRSRSCSSNRNSKSSRLTYYKKSSVYLEHREIICYTFSEIAFLFCIVDPAFPLLKSAIVEFIVVGRELVVGIVVMVTVCGVHWDGWEVGTE